MKELCRSFLFVLASQGLDAFDHEDDGEDDEQDAKNDLSVRTPVGAARLNRNDLVLYGQCQGTDGNNHHECHGNQEHLVVLTDIAKPGCNCKKAKSCKELVCCSEEAPRTTVKTVAK